jgi:hypothetical protein
MKTFVLIICITGFIGLAWNSKSYKPVHIKPEIRLTEAKAVKPEVTKPIILKGTYKPKNERDRQKAIAEIWHVKGDMKETKIFEARK